MIYRSNFPVPPALMAAGAAYETLTGRIGEREYELFRNAPQTLNQRLAETLALRRAIPDAWMTEQDGSITTFGAFEARAAGLRAHLQDTLGLGFGDRAALVMANRAEWMIAFFAVLAAGGVPVLVNSRGAGPEMRRAVAATRCAVVIADRERSEVMAEGGGPGLPVVILGGGEDPPAIPGARLDFAPRSPEDPALIMFSSGTTGHPKAIVHGQGGMAHAVTLGLLLDEAYEALYAREFGEDPFAGIGPEPPATVLSSPLFHVAGLLPYLRAIVKGAATIMVGKWNADTVYDILERNTVIRLGLVPTMIFDMLASPRMAGGAPSQLRFLANGTAALAPKTAAAIRQALPQCLLTNTYGQTETMERVAGFGGQEYEANLAAVGRVVPTTMLRVLREDGSEADAGEVGEIAAYGANTMTGYYGDAEASEQTIKRGWVLSGDLGRFDENGLLHIVDRKKNMVIAGGENIYCAEVERVMAEHPAVAEALAFGEPDERLGERLVAVAVLKTGKSVSEDELKAHCRAALAIYKVPRAIGFTDKPLPRNATGKIAKGEFLKGYKRPWAKVGEMQP